MILRSNKIRILIVLALVASSLYNDVIAQEKVVFNETITWEWPIPKWYGGYSFYWWHRSKEGVGVTNYGEMSPTNWQSPANYKNGTFYMRFEVISQPTTTPFRLQFGIWQDVSKSGGHSEAISGNVNMSGGAGSVTATSIGSPSSWWQIRTDAPVDFTRPEDFYRIGIVLWKGNCVPKGSSWGSEGCPEYQAQFFPMKAKVTVVAVAQGSTFSGWSNYTGGTPTNEITVNPTSKTVTSAMGSTTFAVSSNVVWAVSESADWLTVTKTNATTLTVNYNANATTSNRSATITFSGTGVTNKTVTLTQEGTAALTLAVTPTTKTVTSPTGSTTFAVASNVVWSASESATWLTVTKTNATTLTVNYNANTTTSNRSATITLSGTGVNNKTVTLTQQGTTTTDPGLKVGNTTIFSSTGSNAYRKAQPVTMTETGTITSITLYHNGGSGNMRMAIYDDVSGKPGHQIAVVPVTTVNRSAGWQKVNLTLPVTVSKGSRVWLAWVFQNSVGTRYTTGTPGRAQSGATYSGGMPDQFGTSSVSTYKYSIYANYTVSSSSLTKIGAGNNQIDKSIIIDQPLNFEFSVYPTVISTSFTISLTLPEAQKATILLYNASGIRIAELWSGNLKSGENRLYFNDLSNIKKNSGSNLLLLQLILSDRIETKKIILNVGD